MALRICVLASGSSGNCTYVGSEMTGLLLDAGISAREIARRLEAIGVGVAHIQGVCVSHEHADHTSGLPVLCRRHGLPVYINSATMEVLAADNDMHGIQWRVFSTGSAFQIGDLVVEPFSVPHDAMDPVGFVVSHNGAQVGVATDVGMVTALLRERLRRCRALVVEANHDEHLLENSKRPWYLKQRIRGRQGHLSNRGAAEVLAEIAGAELEQVFLAHLSQECNTCQLALKTVTEHLQKAGHHRVRVNVTYPDRISEVWTG
jgi:phosphoribosyl 1,2-cyclic phosphodiesterase